MDIPIFAPLVYQKYAQPDLPPSEPPKKMLDVNQKKLVNKMKLSIQKAMSIGQAGD